MNTPGVDFPSGLPSLVAFLEFKSREGLIRPHALQVQVLFKPKRGGKLNTMAAASTEFGFTAEDIDTMSYRNLQKKCKSNGIKANGKADVLRKRLRDLITVRDPCSLDLCAY